MEISELTIWIARMGVIFLMYLLLLLLILAIRADARAASESPSPSLRPSPLPAQATPAAPAVAPPVHRLLVTAGTLPRGGRDIQLFGTMEIGRNASCAISIPNHFVSTRHARLLMQEGRWLLEDLDSTNGTLINEQLLIGSRTLALGDKILIGDTEFLVQ